MRYRYSVVVTPTHGEGLVCSRVKWVGLINYLVVCACGGSLKVLQAEDGGGSLSFRIFNW